MGNSLLGNPFFDGLAAEHRTWLAPFDPQYLANWERLLSADEDAAFAEAGVRGFLQGCDITVEPNEDLNGAGRRPDFLCLGGGRKFYVEVTNLSIESATATTGIPIQGGREVSPFQPLTKAVFSKCRRKAAQCGNLDAPALVAVGTFHALAAMLGFDKTFASWLLTGETGPAWPIDIRTGHEIGDAWQTTKLDRAAFLRPDETQGVGDARNSISGLLLCPLALKHQPVIGLLHPNPVHLFDVAILPQVEFGRVVIDRASQRLEVIWRRGSEEQAVRESES